MSTSRLTNLSFKAGTAQLSFVDPVNDPIARLEVKKITQVLDGTLDDFYPETIQTL